MSDWQDKSVFGWDYPPGVTARMIDERVGDEDEGVEIDTVEGVTINIASDSSQIILAIIDHNLELLDQYTLTKGQVQALVRAIQDRL